jgi:hypothetical protein
MLARLGDVLYWLGCILAGLTVAAGAFLWFAEGHARKDGIAVVAGFLVFALILWLIGRACRYVLAGR